MQRLCIARAIANRPKVLLMDEPCSALDPIATARVEQLISELKKEFTIVIVTHNMQQATRCSDHTGFFYLGKLVEFGTTGENFHQPVGKTHRGLHHRPLRLTLYSVGNGPCDGKFTFRDCPAEALPVLF